MEFFSRLCIPGPTLLRVHVCFSFSGTSGWQHTVMLCAVKLISDQPGHRYSTDHSFLVGHTDFLNRIELNPSADDVNEPFKVVVDSNTTAFHYPENEGDTLKDVKKPVDGTRGRLFIIP